MAKRRKKDAPVEIMVDESWRARDDISTIQRANEILGDKARFNAAKAEAKRQKESLDRISRLDGVNISGRGRTVRPQPTGAKGARLSPQKESHPKNHSIPKHDRMKMSSKVDQSDTGKV